MKDRIRELLLTNKHSQHEVARIVAKEQGIDNPERIRWHVRQTAKDISEFKEYCDQQSIDVETVRQVWDKSKRFSIKYTPNSEPVNYDEIFTNLLAGVPKVKKIIPPKTETFDRIVFTDTHVGMETDAEGIAPYATKWNADALFSRMNTIVNEMLNNKKSDVLYIDDLGDYMDGFDGLTTRGGHKLPQNMTNHDAFDNGLKAKLMLVDELSKHYDYITVNNVNNDNHCFDDKTEVLTNNGWKFFTEVSDSDTIGTMNENESIEYQKPTNKIYNHVGGEVKMHIYSNKILDVCVTDEHRMLVKRNKYNKNNETYEYIKSKDLKKEGSVKFKSAIKSDTSYDISDDYIKLCAWILTDGTITKNKSYILYQSKKHYKEIYDLINKIGLGFYYSEKKQSENITIKGKEVKSKNKIMHSYALNVKHTGEERMKYINYLVDSKDIPSWVYKLDDRQFMLFLNTWIKADGNKDKRGNSATIYGNYDVLSKLQIACISHNIRSMISMDSRGDYRLCVVLNRNEVNFQMKDFKEEYVQTEYTWCFTMPNSNLIVRRNGKVSIQGNSASFGYTVNSAFKQICDVKYDNVEVHNHKSFLSYYFVGSHCFVITHGKDAKHMKFGFKPQLDHKTTYKIDQFLKNEKIYKKAEFIEISKGDSHQCLFDMCTSDDFDYFCYPALSPSSEWVQTNFTKGRSGFVTMTISVDSNDKTVKPYFFN